MTGDDLLRKGLESAKAQAEKQRQRDDVVTEDRAYLEGRIPEFVDVVERFLQLMSEHGNPGLERFTLKAFPGFTRITPGGWPAKQAWRLDSNLHRAVTPSGEFASFHSAGWLTAAAFIQSEIAGDERMSRKSWHDINKRRTVNFIGDYLQAWVTVTPGGRVSIA